MPIHSLHKNLAVRLSLIAAALLFITSAVAEYQISKATINNGGHHSDQVVMKSPRFIVQASVGQTDANDGLHGNQYQLQGGFWHQNTDLIFKHSLD